MAGLTLCGLVRSDARDVFCGVIYYTPQKTSRAPALTRPQSRTLLLMATLCATGEAPHNPPLLPAAAAARGGSAARLRRPAAPPRRWCVACRLPGSGARGLTWMSLSGSAHSRSHSRPLSGTSVGRATRLIWSRDFSSGDSPPCMHRICGQGVQVAGQGGRPAAVPRAGAAALRGWPGDIPPGCAHRAAAAAEGLVFCAAGAGCCCRCWRWKDGGAPSDPCHRRRCWHGMGARCCCGCRLAPTTWFFRVLCTHLLIYERRHWQAVEAVCERPPQPDVVPVQGRGSRVRGQGDAGSPPGACTRCPPDAHAARRACCLPPPSSQASL